MKKAARIVLAILGSKWFYPVSFFMGVYMTIPVFEAIVAWRGEGETPHNFYILTESPATNTLTPILLYKRKGFLEQHQDARFLLSSSQGKFPFANGTVTYFVTEQVPQKQKVRLFVYDDTYKFTSIYLVDGATIVPVYWTVFGALVLAWCPALGLLFVVCISFISRRTLKGLS